nr:dihydropyrimidine dehydrogenase (NADP) (EC 1.3.1.2) - Alcaligenes eutrophus (fragments) [Cupriavidus necator]
ADTRATQALVIRGGT